MSRFDALDHIFGVELEDEMQSDGWDEYAEHHEAVRHVSKVNMIPKVETNKNHT
jgi:hypothetical protein